MKATSDFLYQRSMFERELHAYPTLIDPALRQLESALSGWCLLFFFGFDHVVRFPYNDARGIPQLSAEFTKISVRLGYCGGGGDAASATNTRHAPHSTPVLRLTPALNCPNCSCSQLA